MIYTIVGGGFGLYGYLPALLARNSKVFLDVRYRKRLLERTELQTLDCLVEWTSTPEEALAKAKSIIIATSPSDQLKLVNEVLDQYPNIEEFFLEKPLSQSPDAASRLLVHLEENSKMVSVGFLFLRCPWAKKLKSLIGISRELSITWSFKAYHYEQKLITWKRQHELGGGALRFYGIHLIALLSSMGFSAVLESIIFKDGNSEVIKWKAIFIGRDSTRCTVVIDVNSDSKIFQVMADSQVVADMSDPFDDIARVDSILDRRLLAVIEHLDSGASRDLSFLHQVNSLWCRVERLST